MAETTTNADPFSFNSFFGGLKDLASGYFDYKSAETAAYVNKKSAAEQYVTTGESQVPQTSGGTASTGIAGMNIKDLAIAGFAIGAGAFLLKKVIN